MANIITLGGSSGGGSVELNEITYDEYQALPEATKKNGEMYFLTDVNGDGSQFQPVIISEVEREIGVFSNGKPLYEKTVYISTLGSDYQAVAHNISNVDIIYINNAFAEYDVESVPHFAIMSSYTIPSEEEFVGVVNPTNIIYRAGTYLIGGYAFITVRYTKTTDTAASGTWTPQGIPAVHYSTNEHIVGTWIDGTTVYEKTIDLGSGGTNISNSSWTTLSGVSITNLNDIIEASGFSPSNKIFTPMLMINDSGTIKALVGRSNAPVEAIRYITIKYTKTS